MRSLTRSAGHAEWNWRTRRSGITPGAIEKPVHEPAPGSHLHRMGWAEETAGAKRARRTNPDTEEKVIMQKHWKSCVRLAAVAMLAACSADPNVTATTAPLQPHSAVQALEVGPLPIGTLTAVHPLTRRSPLRSDVATSATIGVAGGVLRLPQVGLTITVPPGAVTAPTDFSVTALAGTEVAYEFEPHGTVFLRPLTAVQELRGTRHTLAQSALMAGYFADRSSLNVTGLGMLVSERIAGAVDLRRTTFTWPIQHFSGYIVAW